MVASPLQKTVRLSNGDRQRVIDDDSHQQTAGQAACRTGQEALFSSTGALPRTAHEADDLQRGPRGAGWNPAAGKLCAGMPVVANSRYGRLCVERLRPHWMNERCRFP